MLMKLTPGKVIPSTNPMIFEALFSCKPSKKTVEFDEKFFAIFFSIT